MTVTIKRSGKTSEFIVDLRDGLDTISCVAVPVEAWHWRVAPPVISARVIEVGYELVQWPTHNRKVHQIPPLSRPPLLPPEEFPRQLLSLRLIQ